MWLRGSPLDGRVKENTREEQVEGEDIVQSRKESMAVWVKVVLVGGQRDFPHLVTSEDWTK